MAVMPLMKKARGLPLAIHGFNIVEIAATHCKHHRDGCPQMPWPEAREDRQTRLLRTCLGGWTPKATGIWSNRAGWR